MRVLVVEDDGDIGPSVARFLREAGYAVDLVANRLDADERLSVNAYDVLVFDRGLPDGDGLELLRDLRQQDNLTPALFLTGYDTVMARVEGLTAGADDYLVKPFAMSELVARVHALTRRRASKQEISIGVSDLELDPNLRLVIRSGKDLSLTSKEFTLLRYLMANPGRVVTRTELIEHCWDEMAEPMSNVVDVKVAQLRKKLGQPPLVHTVRGAGYVLSEDAPP